MQNNDYSRRDKWGLKIEDINICTEGHWRRKDKKGNISGSEWMHKDASEIQLSGIRQKLFFFLT